MKNRMSIYSLILAAVVLVYLVREFIKPISSVVILVAAILMSIIGLACAVNGVRHEKSILNIVAVSISSVITGMMLCFFLTMFIMGM